MSQTDQAPLPPDIGRRTLTPFGYGVAIVVPILIAAIGLTILHFNYDPEDVVTGKRIPLLTSDWRPGDGGDAAEIAGVLVVDDQDCVRLQTSDGQDLSVVWPFDYEATYTAGSGLKLYDTDRKIAARDGDTVRMGGGYGDVGEYAGRPCAPAVGTQVAFVQSTVVVTARGTRSRTG